MPDMMKVIQDKENERWSSSVRNEIKKQHFILNFLEHVRTEDGVVK